VLAIELIFGKGTFIMVEFLEFLVEGLDIWFEFLDLDFEFGVIKLLFFQLIP
jgi:hypothetical protein